MRSLSLTLILLNFFPYVIHSQILRPGYDNTEYVEMLKINQKAHIEVNKWAESTIVPDPQEYDFVYRSPRVAFDNIWDLWKHKHKNIAVIAVQGSISTSASFLANLYAAMIPATGTLQLDDHTSWSYTLADDDHAAVHVGWLVALAHLSFSIEDKIDSLYRTGTRDFILTGHSQGGAITYLLTAYLRHKQLKGVLPADIVFKTYCSAAPKPGNLFFAYDYETVTLPDMAFNVVNTIDWVPDVPFSIQTLDDYTAVNPFRGAKSTIKKQKFPKNIALKYVYNRLSKPGKKAQRNYQKYLGKMISRSVKKQLPGMKLPEYYSSNYYVRTGRIILLRPTEDYFKLYSNDISNTDIWQHHLPLQYLYLAERQMQ